jgi:hypothetical protein
MPMNGLDESTQTFGPSTNAGCDRYPETTDEEIPGNGGVPVRRGRLSPREHPVKGRCRFRQRPFILLPIEGAFATG